MVGPSVLGGQSHAPLPTRPPMMRRVRRSVDKRFEAFWAFQKYVLGGRDGLACCRRNVFFSNFFFFLKTRHLLVFCLSCIFLIFCKFLMVRIQYATKKMLSFFFNIHFEAYRHSFSSRDANIPKRPLLAAYCRSSCSIAMKQ